MDNITKNFLAAVCAVASFVIGEWCGHLSALVALVVLDYISGVAAAVIEKRFPRSWAQRALPKRFLCFLSLLLLTLWTLTLSARGMC